uniref:Protein transport protein SEC13 n=1 Tax=Alexandrium catenella TaxID=2925 RepID=A0A7S1PYN3_ALECA|mmetsp:Transcript_11536/g.31425  ORF Transcript_11536/g.31425 Transcript_11536/m.31425 type:complete len:322 (+) Transcript_11536:64-1029(+)
MAQAKVLGDFDTGHCGAIHDTQLDCYGECLATASADGHVRLWDIREPEKPSFMADLGGHAGPVHQVSWASPMQGVLLASAGDDGLLLVWGRRFKPGEWLTVHSEDLRRHGALRAVAWAPGERGAVIACASDDGTVTVVSHAGAFDTDEETVEHRWASHPWKAHSGHACAVSWATPRCVDDTLIGLAGARLASAGADGVRVWAWDAANSRWDPEPFEAADIRQKPARDVAWKPWDGVCETLASASGQEVAIWEQEAPEGGAGRWRAAGQVDLGEEVWKLSWTDIGGLLLVSLGEEEPHSVLLKRRLDGVWDVMPVEAEEECN